VLRDRLLHRLAWEAGRARLRAGAGRGAFTPPPSGPAAALHVTTVARLPAEVVSALAPALDRLRATGPGHHYYPPGTVHLTVQNLDGLDLDGEAAAARLAELMALAGSHPPFPAAVRALASPRARSSPRCSPATPPSGRCVPTFAGSLSGTPSRARGHASSPTPTWSGSRAR
jgi:hypothetical protein